jgi:hypothetical protein
MWWFPPAVLSRWVLGTLPVGMVTEWLPIGPASRYLKDKTILCGDDLHFFSIYTALSYNRALQDPSISIPCPCFPPILLRCPLIL